MRPKRADKILPGSGCIPPRQMSRAGERRLPRVLIRSTIGFGQTAHPRPSENVLYDGSPQGNGLVWETGRIKIMSYRAQAGIAAVAVLVLTAGAFYWLRGRSAKPPAGVVLTSEPGPTEKPSATWDEANEKPEKAVGSEHVAPTAVKTAAPGVAAGLSLRSGEVLEYTADVAKLSHVANLRLQVAEQRNFLGKGAWHLQAFAHTESPLRMVFELDDQFDSYSDAGTLSSLQYEMHLSERGQRVDSVQRLTTTGKEPAPENATQARVLPGTRDPLGMMQYLRNVDWTKTREVRGPVYDGRKLYDVRASLAEASEAVTVPAGSYTATKVEIRVFDEGAEMKDAHFFVYLDHNSTRTPVLLEAVLPFATARVALKSSR
jgi:hypothetical protein